MFQLVRGEKEESGDLMGEGHHSYMPPDIMVFCD